MKAKFQFTKKGKNFVSMRFVGIDEKEKVDDLYKRSAKAAARRYDTFSKVDESIMKRKFSI